MNTKKKMNEGWSFMETLIVIAVVLILTAAVGFMAVGSLEKARIANVRAQLDSFSVALEAYYIDCGRYPTVEQGLKALRAKPVIEPINDNWNGPYLYKEPPKDPGGNEYEYMLPGPEGSPYGLRSFGADGVEGGENANADITSWQN